MGAFYDFCDREVGDCDCGGGIAHIVRHFEYMARDVLAKGPYCEHARGRVEIALRHCRAHNIEVRRLEQQRKKAEAAAEAKIRLAEAKRENERRARKEAEAARVR